MEIWLKNTESDSIRLPVLPSSFNITDANSNTSITVHNVGEVNLLGKPELLTTELTSFWPNHEYPFCQYTGFIKPKSFIEKIRKWKKENVLPRLIITGTDINITMSIESFQFGEEDSTGDVKYTICLKEYKKVAYTKKTSRSSSKKNSKTKTVNYTVKKRDTLRKIAKKFTGSSGNASKIYAQNKKVIEKAAKKHKKKCSSKGKWIFPGTKLVIKT